ncbi:nuclear transport factor 2 family protein [Flavobacterium sp. LHD-80]|uniref:nuclear transport factor 2 family protein n=1 Tax=Flavobacterium sp. LHD-80 TaxID=3071411 RepID=UPI0027E0C30F|nr:nuclear transport factor 2 family protein [Flavobacterium sp. LHD-80]MDQ6472320.1 nuclear transport factor 2 family protein [Flavobacterium sp. LHD-80]
MKKFLVLVFLNFSVFGFAQVAKDSELFLQLKKHDSIFFEKSFNQCDIAFLEKAIHPDLVFYHDQGGVQNKKTFLENVKKNICAKNSQKPIRKVKAESLEVYPLYDNGKLYGVVQTGIHDFYLREANKPDVFTSEAKFTHVYLLINKEWVLKEVLSFDHKS